MLAMKVLDKVSTHKFMRVCITTIDHLKELNVVDSETRMKLQIIILLQYIEREKKGVTKFLIS
jgi:hypothetical protein